MTRASVSRWRWLGWGVYALALGAAALAAFWFSRGRDALACGTLLSSGMWLWLLRGEE